MCVDNFTRKNTLWINSAHLKYERAGSLEERLDVEVRERERDGEIQELNDLKICR